jgi:hypothetical protein
MRQPNLISIEVNEAQILPVDLPKFCVCVGSKLAILIVVLDLASSDRQRV